MTLPGGLYAILDLPHAHGLAPARAAAAMLAGGAGASVIQLRAKQVSGAARARMLAEVGAVCAAVGAPLIVNDDVEAALLGIVGVRGVHLGQGDLAAAQGRRPGWQQALRAASLMVGVSTHSLEQVAAVEALGVDYVGYGPLFPTRSKANPEPCVGLEGLRTACSAAALPVVAIGGMDAARGEAAIRAGARAVAVISALVATSEEETRARAVALARRLAEVGRLVTPRV